MSSIPFNPPRFNPLEQIGEATSLANMRTAGQLQQTELQTRQLQLQDVKAQTDAMHEWDGSDIDKLPGLILKHGGSAQAVWSSKQQILAYKKQLADTQKTELENQQKQNDHFAQSIENVLAKPAAEQPQAFEAEKQQAIKLGYLDPQQAQGLQYQGPEQLQQLKKVFMGHSAAVEDALKTAQTGEAGAKTGEAQAQTQKIQAEMPGGPLYSPSDNLLYQRAAAGDPQAKSILKTKQQQEVGTAVQKETNPQIQAGKVQVAAAEGAARANIEHQFAVGSNAAVANVPTHLVGPATEAAKKAADDYAQAKSVSDRIQLMMDAAKSGNVVSYQLIPQEGALQVTTSQGVHRINMAEIQNYGGGSYWQMLQAHIGKALSGKSIPDSVLKDMSEMQGIMAEGSKTKYENTLEGINQNYGSSFKPVEMKNVQKPQQQVTRTYKGRTYVQQPDGSWKGQ